MSKAIESSRHDLLHLKMLISFITWENLHIAYNVIADTFVNEDYFHLSRFKSI